VFADRRVYLAVATLVVAAVCGIRPSLVKTPWSKLIPAAKVQETEKKRQLREALERYYGAKSGRPQVPARPADR
jgi:hypothetical protein